MADWHKVIIKPTGIVADVQIGDQTCENVTVKGEWEGLVKLEAPFKQGHIIGGKPTARDDLNLFKSFFSESVHMFFQEVEISPLRASGDFLEAVKIKEPKEETQK